MVLVVAALALGIGANLTAFVILYGSLLRPLPYQDAGSLVMVWQVIESSKTQIRRLPVTADVLARWRQPMPERLDLAAVQLWRNNVSTQFDLAGTEGVERLRGGFATPNVFSLLGVSAWRGRVFDPSDESAIAVLSYGLWMRRFGGDDNVIGQSVNLTAGRVTREPRSVTIVGVLPQKFQFTYPEETDIWVLLPWRDVAAASRQEYTVVGRLGSQMTLPQAEAALEGRASASNRNPDLWVESMHEYAVGKVRPMVWLMTAATGALFILACVNVAGILLAQAMSRRREFAMQIALGASYSGIVRQLLLECSILTGFAATASVLSLFVSLPILRRLLPASVPRVNEIGVESSSLVWILILVGLVILIAMIPSLVGAKVNVQSQLAESGRSTSPSRVASRWRVALITVQTATVVTLAISGALLLRSFWETQRVDLGFDGRGVLVVNLQLMGRRYLAPASRAAFQSDLVDRIAALPSIERVGITSSVPLRSGTDWRRLITTSDGEQLSVNERQVDAGYFDVMRIPLRSGRLFDGSDDANRPPVAIVSERLASILYPNRSAVGSLLPLRVPAEIVGVVTDVRQVRIDEQPAPAYYLHRLQDPSELVSLVIQLRNHLAEPEAVAGVRSTLRAIDPSQPIDSITTLDRLKSDSGADRQLFAAVTVAMGIIGVLVSVIGLYGVIRRLTVERMKEFGVRAALGARPRDLVALVSGQALVPVGIGGAVGATVALMAANLIAPFLYRVSATDWPTYLGVITAVVVVCALAIVTSALQAGRVDPVEQLRHD